MRGQQGSWQAPNALWIAMEYCAGGSVSDLMRAAGAPLAEHLIAFVTAHTLAGLAYLHSVGKVRRPNTISLLALAPIPALALLLHHPLPHFPHNP